MELFNDPVKSASERVPAAPVVDSPLDGNDPELERELEELAQWLLDVYLWKLQQERKARGIDQVARIDNDPPPVRI
jgi:hypothetical protein